MKERERKVRVNKEVEEGRAEDPKKEFKIEIVKVGKLEENTEGPVVPDNAYLCEGGCS